MNEPFMNKTKFIKEATSTDEAEQLLGLGWTLISITERINGEKSSAVYHLGRNDAPNVALEETESTYIGPIMI
ncbi:hypothetical protein FACS189490_04080 [Clostridia bacterium]|nr:hypothetical protein FACS189490_04080 [Clostridia bacterium]